MPYKITLEISLPHRPLTIKVESDSVTEATEAAKQAIREFPPPQQTTTTTNTTP